MKLRHYPTYEAWRASHFTEMQELHVAAQYPETDRQMRTVDQWVRWVYATDAMQDVVREAAEAIRRARG
jgi:hypothetical protein